jgi:hypothetical protein
MDGALLFKMDRGVDTFLVNMDEGHKAGASEPLMSDGQLRLGLVEGQAFLFAGDWLYPLLPEHVCLRMGPRFYVFDTEDEGRSADRCVHLPRRGGRGDI